MSDLPALVVTGASTGLGYAIAALALGRGARVYAGVRTEADGARLRAELGPDLRSLPMDVTQDAAVAAAAAEVTTAEAGRRLMGLVNNAGITVPGPLLHMTTAELEAQLAVNLIGVHRVTRAFAPLLGAEGPAAATEGRPGRIVMISSTSGRRAMPFIAAYAASKFALEGYAEGLRRELLPFGIAVVTVAPGPVRTPIWQKGLTLDRGRYAGSTYAPALETFTTAVGGIAARGLGPEAVAKQVWRALTAPTPPRRIAITPTPLQDRVLGLLPGHTLDRIIARRLGLRTV